jgi:chemotaxis protein CheZ
VIDVITRTEMQLVQLLLDSSPDAVALSKANAEVVEVTVENHVLEGPQTDGSALKQDDVDDLLASLGF